MAPGLTYVVTGGCGFLGTHIVDMLVQKGKNISEIRVVDMKPRSDRLPKGEGIEVSLIRGDVTDMAQMTEVCAGADVIIHSAAVIDVFGLVSDETLWEVNVKGTENLLRCCVNEDIPCFVYTSSLEAVGPNRRGDPLEDGDESTPYDTTCPVFPYSGTKAAAEAMVLQWNGRHTNGGKTLHTCSLRPGEIYGEGEMAALALSQRMGVDLFAAPLKRLGGHVSKFTCCYVGNVAWAHLLAAEKLMESPGIAGGQAFFISDDTPQKNRYALFSELFAPVGISWEDNPILPIWLLYFIAYLLAFISFLVKPMYNFAPLLTPGLLTMVNTTFYFNYKKAARLLGYKPLFTWAESKQRTADWLVEWKSGGATFP